MDVKSRDLYKLCLHIMQSYGLYNCADGTIKQRRYRIMRCTMLLVILICVKLGFLRNFISSRGIVSSTNYFVYVLFVLLILIKIFNNASKREELVEIKQQIAELEHEIAADERHTKLENLELRLQLTKKMSKMFLILVTVFNLNVLFLTVAFEKYPVNVFGKFEAGSIGVWVTAIFMNLADFFTIPVLICSDLTPILLLTYATGFNDELATRLKQIGISKEFDYDELKECIKIHQMIKIFFDKVSDCFRLILYLHNIFSQLIICMSMFNLVYADDLNDVTVSFFLALLALFEILMPCYFATELEKSSENLLDAIYQSDWLNCELRTKKMMVTFMENLKQPMQINCYLIFDVNMELFAKILNEAYSFYCILNELA